MGDSRSVKARSWQVGGVAFVVAALAFVLAARFGGGLRVENLPGLPIRYASTGWLLSVARLVSMLGAVCTVGLLVGATVLAPRDDGGLSPAGYRRIRAASLAAAVWTVASLAMIWLTLADLLSAPPNRVPRLSAWSFITSIPLGRALLVTAGVALVAAVVCRVTLTPAGAAVALVLAGVGVAAPVFTGHAASAGNHQVATSALLLHVVPVTVWAGGLVALLLSGRQKPADLAVAVGRFSTLAAWCLAAVTASGLVSAWVRVGDAAGFVESRYGVLALAKAVLLAGIAALGAWHRSRGLPRLREGDPGVFRRVAGVEVGLFAAAIGVAVALSRTPPPDLGDEGDVVTTLLGFPMPPPLTAARLAGDWLPEPLFLAAAVAAVVLYLSGVWRLRRRGDRWPAHRVAVWLAGWAVVVVATGSGLARYAPVLFSVHMVQHLALTMVAPVLLALSAPVTLLLRAVPADRDHRWPGVREWTLGCLHSAALRWLTHPVVALALFVGGLYAMYFTGLFELALRSHLAHLAMLAHFLGVGYLFFWTLIGTDPAPRRVGYPLRMLIVVGAMVLHAILGVALMQGTAPLAADWYAQLDRPWGPSALADQRTGGAIAWSFGELPTLLVLLALFAQWARADEREQRRIDRAAERADASGEDDELAAYNRMLAEVARREARPGGVAARRQ